MDVKPAPGAPHLSVVDLGPKLLANEVTSYTQAAMNCLAEAQKIVEENEAAGKPVTQMVVCMTSEYDKGSVSYMRPTHCISEHCSNLAALGVLDVTKAEMLDRGA